MTVQAGPKSSDWTGPMHERGRPLLGFTCRRCFRVPARAGGGGGVRISVGPSDAQTHTALQGNGGTEDSVVVQELVVVR